MRYGSSVRGAVLLEPIIFRAEDAMMMKFLVYFASTFLRWALSCL